MGLDRRVERFVVHHRTEWLDPVFRLLSYAGTQGLVWIAIGAVLAAVVRRPPVLLWLVVADAAADLSA